MKRQLIILRHAKSDWDSSAVRDYDRPLSESGDMDAPRIGQWLKNHGYVPDYIISSPALRAVQTAEAVSYTLGIDPQNTHYEKTIYLADRSNLLKVLENIPADRKSVMLVGHNPGLDELLIYLAKNKMKLTKSGKLLTTAAAAILSMPECWQNIKEHSATLVDLTRPKEL